MQEVDVVGRKHVRYFVPPGAGLVGPRAIAATSALVAVTAWRASELGDHVVALFDAATRVLLRRVGGAWGSADGALHCPRALCFTGGGTHVAVADYGNSRVSVFGVADGAFERHVPAPPGYTLEGPTDVVETQQGLLVPDFKTHTVLQLCTGLGEPPVGHCVALGGRGHVVGALEYPTALVHAHLPAGTAGTGTPATPGIVVREYGHGGRLHVFAPHA